jgi:hypothetical protein
MAPGGYVPATTWGAQYYDQGPGVTSGSNWPGVVISYGSPVVIPAPELRYAAPTKQERARAAMRRYLSSVPRLHVAVTEPATPMLIARDPLRYHRQRAVRRAPRLSHLRRSA